MSETCASCRFSHATETDEVQCRRYPPTLDGVVESDGLFFGVADFIVVRPTDWCGEYLPPPVTS